MTVHQPTNLDIGQWARLGPRGTYGQAIFGFAEENPKIVALSADLGNSSGLDRFRSAYPERFINVGIAEQNLVGVASGVSRSGFSVFASSFSPFIAMRASEQIRMNLGYMGENVNLVAIGSGLSMGFLGNSHFGIEDAAVMRSIPGMRVVSPADCLEIVKVIEACIEFPAPTYIRLTGAPNGPKVYEEDYDFQIGKSIKLRDGKDVALVATGSMVSAALVACDILYENGISAEVVNMHTIKPIDTKALDEITDRHNFIVTIEEHSIIGGLGSAIAEYLCELGTGCRLKMIGLPDRFGPTADYKFLLEHHGLTGNAIASTVDTFLAGMNND